MLLIKNGDIKTMAGPEIANGSILIGDDGKIIAVGEGISAPAMWSISVVTFVLFAASLVDEILTHGWRF